MGSFLTSIRRRVLLVLRTKTRSSFEFLWRIRFRYSESRVCGFDGGGDGAGGGAEQGGGRLRGGEANRRGVVLRGVAREAQGARHRGGDQGDRHASPQQEVAGEPHVRDFHLEAD